MKILFIRIKYWDVRVSIKLKLWGKLFKLHIAGWLLKLVNKLSPELMAMYDRSIVHWYEQTGQVGIRWKVTN